MYDCDKEDQKKKVRGRHQNNGFSRGVVDHIERGGPIFVNC